MKLDRYKNIRRVMLSLLVVGGLLMFTQIDKSWAIVLIVIAFLIGANAIDKRQKESLDKRINELDKRINEIEERRRKS